MGGYDLLSTYHFLRIIHVCRIMYCDGLIMNLHLMRGYLFHAYLHRFFKLLLSSASWKLLYAAFETLIK